MPSIYCFKDTYIRFPVFITIIKSGMPNYQSSSCPASHTNSRCVRWDRKSHHPHILNPLRHMFNLIVRDEESYQHLDLVACEESSWTCETIKLVLSILQCFLTWGLYRRQSSEKFQKEYTRLFSPNTTSPNVKQA